MTRRRSIYKHLRFGLAVFVIGSATFAANHDFIADVTFKGSSLKGWHTVGNTDWRAENGEIIANPKQQSGGWLVLDKGYQDIQLYSEFRCGGPCKTGVLLRAGKTPEGGMKGVYVSLSEGDPGATNSRERRRRRSEPHSP